MALAPLATTADLSALGVDTTDATLVASLLASVSADVREAAGAAISSTTSTVVIQGSREQWLALPGGPIVSVASVKIDDAAVADFRLVEGRLWRSSGWQGSRAPSLVEVAYTHGYDPVPADIVRLVCMLVSAGIHAAKDGFGSTRGVSSERVDDYQISFTRGDDEVVDPTEIPPRTRQTLRDRFGGSAHVTGSY